MTDSLTQDERPAVTWYTTVTWGQRSGLPRGPWRGHQEAAAALQRWEARTGGRWSRDYTGGTVRVNAYRSRAAARAASIDDSPQDNPMCVSIEGLSNFTRSYQGF